VWVWVWVWVWVGVWVSGCVSKASQACIGALCALGLLLWAQPQAQPPHMQALACITATLMPAPPLTVWVEAVAVCGLQASKPLPLLRQHRSAARPRGVHVAPDAVPARKCVCVCVCVRV
jgi:hypothetical protein